MTDVAEKEFPHLTHDFSRHDKQKLSPRWYVRMHGKKERIRAERGTPAFARAYADAMDILEGRTGRKITRPTTSAAPEGTVGWLAARYFAHSVFTDLAPKSQATRRLIIEACLRELDDGEPATPMALCPIEAFNASAVLMLMERKGGKPGAANNRKKYLSAMFGWGVQNLRKHVVANPCRDADRKKYATDGFHTWSIDEVRQFVAHHPIGTKPYLAMSLLLFTGARRGDMVNFGRQHIKGGKIRYVPNKTLYKRRTMSVKPVLPILAQAIEAGPTGDLTFLVTEFGKAFTDNGFGNWFRDQCRAANLDGCSAHGLKKAAATLAAENGATGPQLMALFDWSTLAQAEPYIRAASREMLATDAAAALEVGHSAVSPLSHRSETA